MDRFTGAISEDADLRLEAWLATSNENRVYYEDLHKMWNSLNILQEEEQYDSERAFRLFKERVGMEKETRRQPVAKSHSFKLKRTLSYAAILIPLIILSYFTYQYYNLYAEKQKAPLLSEVVVPNGSKTMLTLQDGTKVWLNAGSKLEYDSNFGKENRLIKLSGEAYLEVTKNKECPFIVDAGEVKVRVLGTSFNVCAYKGNEDIKVALLQGSVEMETDNGTMLKLKPKDIAHFNTNTKKTEICHNKNCSLNSIGWIDNKLVFNGESFEQITYTLERTFNVKINIHRESVKKRCFIGDFVNNETIEQIFKVMSSDEKFNYTIKGNIIDVY